MAAFGATAAVAFSDFGASSFGCDGKLAAAGLLADAVSTLFAGVGGGVGGAVTAALSFA